MDAQIILQVLQHQVSGIACTNILRSLVASGTTTLQFTFDPSQFPPLTAPKYTKITAAGIDFLRLSECKDEIGVNSIGDGSSQGWSICDSYSDSDYGVYSSSIYSQKSASSHVIGATVVVVGESGRNEGDEEEDDWEVLSELSTDDLVIVSSHTELSPYLEHDNKVACPENVKKEKPKEESKCFSYAEILIKGRKNTATTAAPLSANASCRADTDPDCIISSVSTAPIPPALLPSKVVTRHTRADELNIEARRRWKNQQHERTRQQKYIDSDCEFCDGQWWTWDSRRDCMVPATE